MPSSFINYDLLKTFDPDCFIQQQPYPWYNFHQLLTPQGFQILYRDFPSLELFEKHQRLERNYGQRPHDRYDLAYEHSVYHPATDRGVVRHSDLPESWQQFIEEIATSQLYQRFIQRMLGTSAYNIRYAWHMGMTNSEVSPHEDGPKKVGTHIFYFNTDQDWDNAWGGPILVLGNRRSATLNPDFEDFAIAIPAEITNNHSFLFKNTPEAWHGVKPLTCPEGKYRRLFNVIFEVPDQPQSWKSRLSLVTIAQKLRR